MIRLPTILLPVALAATVAACSVRTERTVYAPPAGRPVYVPTSVAYVPAPARIYYYDSYDPAYYSY